MVLTYFATHYNVGFAVPMAIATTVATLSFAASLVYAPETKGKILVAYLVVA